MNSRQKGARGEREAAQVLRDTFGCEARRGCQFSGGEDSPDVATSLDGIHIEVKRVERLNIHEAIGQAVRDAGEKIPCVMHRRDRTEWLVTMRLTDAKDFAAKLAEAIGKADEGVGG